jgi:hypothetical protein
MTDQLVRGVAVEWNGTLYRSITEAMWAIVGDNLGWELEYEPIRDKNRIPGLYYIPDFYSEFLRMFIEIKGSMPLDFDKQIALAKATGRWVVVFIGKPNKFVVRWINTKGEICEHDTDFTKTTGWAEAVHVAMSEFGQWNPPVVSAPRGGEWFATRTYEEDGLWHPTFGAGIIDEEIDDEYGNTLICVKEWVGKGGMKNYSYIRADLVRFVDRSRIGQGWTVGSNRSMDPADYLWNQKTFHSDVEGRPWFFCRECERVRDLIDHGRRGSDLTITRRRMVGQRETYWGMVPEYEDDTFYASFYCQDCTMRYESGMPGSMEIGL